MHAVLPPINMACYGKMYAIGEKPVKRSSPSCGFGSSSRAGSEASRRLSTPGSDSPGPLAAYEVPKAIGGKQPDARRRNEPIYSFSKGKRGDP